MSGLSGTMTSHSYLRPGAAAAAAVAVDDDDDDDEEAMARRLLGVDERRGWMARERACRRWIMRREVRLSCPMLLW